MYIFLENRHECVVRKFKSEMEERKETRRCKIQPEERRKDERSNIKYRALKYEQN